MLHVTDDGADRLTQAVTHTESYNIRNLTENLHRSNSWPEFIRPENQGYLPLKNDFGVGSNAQNPAIIHYQSQLADEANNGRNKYRNFEYRVVTDRPYLHSKTPKAYIAVSLIAPKPLESEEEDLLLEHELRQLKPWQHSREFPNLEPFHTRWAKKASERNPNTSP